MEPLLHQRASNIVSTTTSSRSIFGLNLIKKDSSHIEDQNDSPKGPLGLTTLYSPDQEAVVDLVFVHGLNGGSQSTWCKGDASFFWPREWLTKDDAFKDVRIHTFGYSSGLARESILNIQDFATSLLTGIHDSPTIPSWETTPIILVGHSMGGLVIKKAFILGHQMPMFESVVSRFRAIFFLATPHQGAAIANTLSRVLSLVSGPRPFVNDLFPQSPVLQSINDEFPRYCSEIPLFSFFESRPMNYGVGKGLIVEKHCAVMNYPNERRTYLDANHRDVAKYSSPRDSSYMTVRNALATVIESQRKKTSGSRGNVGQERRDALGKFLGVSETPDDVITMQDIRRLPGSGEWLFQKDSFKEWRDAFSSKLLLLRAGPGAGKSFLAGNVINHLREAGLDCCCFFFVSGDNTRSTFSALLRSIAFQMAILHPEILSRITDISMSKDIAIDKADQNAVWRQIYLSAILKVKLNRQQYWVIDAIDECDSVSEIMNFLSKIQELWPLCILKTSRNSFESLISNNNSRLEVLMETIVEEDSKNDISMFLSANINLLPAPTKKAREEIAEQILQRSRGCFLWANLVLKELHQVHTTADIRLVLASTSSDMDELYAKILASMSGARFGKNLAKAILTWATCSFRPLTTYELHTAIQIDIKDTVDDIEKSISSCCGNLVYVDGRKRLQLIHLTAREFLMRQGIESEFLIDKTDGNRRLARVCIQYLMGPEMSGAQKSRNLGVRREVQEISSFTTYACDFLFQHLHFIKSDDDEIFVELARFLVSTSVLRWIEYIAKHSDLQRVYQAGKTILHLLDRRARQSPPIGFQRELSVIERWGNDLIHLVTRFSPRLMLSPSSIYYLIPPFCPQDSMIHKQFANPIRGVRIYGLRETGWDECLTTITYAQGTRPLSSTAGLGFFALGMSTGNVTIYDDTIFKETQILNHQEPVWRLRFGETGKYLASSGAKSVRVWDLETWTDVLKVPLKSMALALAFIENDSVLAIAARNNQLMYWDLDTGLLREEPIDWTRDFTDEGQERYCREPAMAAISPNQNLLAIIYRGEDIILWDIEQDRIHDIYEKETGSRANGSLKIADGSTTVRSLVFSAALDTHLLATTYTDGDLVVYDTFTGSFNGKIRNPIPIVLASSPDGRTLAGGDSKGDILLFDFESLRFLYKISFENNWIMTKSLAFTADGQRLIDIRAHQCRVWQPTVLLRQDADDENSDTVSVSTAPQEVDYQTRDTISITVITCIKLPKASVVFYGKADGSVHVYDISGDLESEQLFLHTRGYPITQLYFDDRGGILSCSDVSGRVTSRKVIRSSRTDWTIGDQLISIIPSSTITQLLGSGLHSRLLVSTKEHDTLWSMDGQSEKPYLAQIEGTKKSRWTSHPTNVGALILCKEQSFELRSWTELEILYIIPFTILNSPFNSVSFIVPLNNQRFFGTIAMNSTSDKLPHSAMHIWDFKDFHEQSEKLSPVGALSPLASSVEVIFGVYAERLLFLDSSYWVCSIDINLAAEFPVRHFFIPNDWISLANNLAMDVGPGGEVIFVKQSELAVIKRGLETTESGAVFNPRQRGLGQMSVLSRRPALSTLAGRTRTNWTA